MSLTRKQITNAITNYLPDIGFRTTNLRSTTKNGGSLRAVHNNYERYFHINVFGDFTNNNKNSFTNKENLFFYALGEFMTQYRPGRRYFYGLAFPDTFKNFAFRNFDASQLKQWNLNFFFVSSKGKVDYITPKNFARKAA